MPIDPATGAYASTAEPDTWPDLPTAQAAVDQFEADGVGYVFTDGCAPRAGNVSEQAARGGPRALRQRVSATETAIEHLERQLAAVKDGLETLRADIVNHREPCSEEEADESNRTLRRVVGWF